MASLIPGYEYDIFISYRQKDNKHDGWVTEFVENLKGELESTFKEDISVYFDINPHDGLLETHDVDASLKEKLKCLIFIPIISRTYCDPKSFAWEHEFKAFVEIVNSDQYGLRVKLPGGNVVCRVLPVLIYSLDDTDKKLFESVLEGHLRGIEFIYKEPGVNRPLTPKDSEDKNNNRTNYRNQINKVANAIREVMTAINQGGSTQEIRIPEAAKKILKPVKKRKTTIIAGFAIALLLLVTGLLFIPKFLESSERSEKTIAVLPFRNLSNDSTQLYFCDGFTEEILNNLQKIGSFTVRSRTSSDQYRDTRKSVTAIGKELNVNYLIEGSVGREGNLIKIWVQLIDTKADKHIWSNDYNRELKQVLTLQTEIAKDIASQLKTVILPEEKIQIDRMHTENLEAYDLYLRGRYFWNRRTKEDLTKSVGYFKRSIAEDPNYALAYAGLADAYFILGWFGWIPQQEGYAKAKEYAIRAVEIDKNLAEAHTTLGWLYCYSDWKWEEARKEFQLAIKSNPNYATARQAYAELLDIIRNNSEARIQIEKALELDPFSWAINAMSAILYYNDGKLEESLGAYQKSEEISPSNYSVYLTYFFIYVRKGENLKAAETVQKYFSLSRSVSKNDTLVNDAFKKSGIIGLTDLLIDFHLTSSDPSSWTIAREYAISGRKEYALNWLDKALEQHDPRLARINSNPDFNDLRSEPRFQAIIRKLGLSEYQSPK